MADTLLFDIGNTHTHLGLAQGRRLIRHRDAPTRAWFEGKMSRYIESFTERTAPTGAAICSVVPKATPLAQGLVRTQVGCEAFTLTARNVRGIGIDYPKPATIGPDRLANAMAVKERFGAPAVVVDFGTAVTFDVVDRNSNYVGGIIAPGLSAMTSYLHEKTALLPAIEIRDVHRAIGKSTVEAMLIGAVQGYRGLIRELIKELKLSLRARKLPVVATGGYAELISAKLPEITAVDPLLTLKGLLLAARPPGGRS